jgi:AMIN domain-containing protein
MLRLFYFAALLGLMASLSVPVSAQTPMPATTHVQHIVMHETAAGLEVEIQTSGAAIAPDTQAITGPDRIIVDFPGALPASELRALKVNRGALKGIRAGLFFNNPPITRVVLDLTEPRSYQISTGQNAVVVKLDSVNLNSAKLSSANSSSDNLIPIKPAVKPTLVPAVGNQPSGVSAQPAVQLQYASLPAHANVGAPTVSAALPRTGAPPTTAPPTIALRTAAPPPSTVIAAPASTPPPAVSVSFVDGMLRIHADKATLAQVLFEVQRQTGADIPIPAGAEQEEVAADLGPSPSRDVLAELLNGSHYNFIFVGSELNLVQVILTRRESSPF